MYRLVLTPALLVVFLITARVEAGSGRSNCGNPCCSPAPCATAASPGPAPAYVERTVMVPTRVQEKRLVKQTVYKQQTHEKKITVQRCVPEQQERTRTYTVMVPEQHTRTIQCNVVKPVWETVNREYTVHIPEWKTVQQTYTVMVARYEKRQGIRHAVKCVPITEKRMVTCDKGHWEKQLVEVPCQSSCGDPCCGCCPRTSTTQKCVWVPNVVTEEVDVTVYRKVTEEVPYEYTATICTPEKRTREVRVCSYRPETRSRQVKVCKYVAEQQEREVTYTVCVPHQKTETYMVTVNKYVPEDKTVRYTVCVPETVEKEVDVTMCKMVPKTIAVPARGGCDGCGC